MELTPKIITDVESFEVFRSLLELSKLPFSDLDYKKHLLVGYYNDNDELVGTGGLEYYGEYALLRSLAVKIDSRGLSIGSFITKDLIAQAQKKKLKGVYLLTETANGFFRLKGFKNILREEVPAPVKASSEFSHVCPSTASCMHLAL